MSADAKGGPPPGCAPGGLGFVREEMRLLQERGLRRSLRTLATPACPRGVVEGKQAVILCSNNYLGLATHPRVVGAAARGVQEWGWGAGASRLIAGTQEAHRSLEEGLAKFCGTESALLFGSGTHANLGTLPALAPPGTQVFSDELNHATLIDGIRLSRAHCRIYPHRDLDALEAMLREARAAPRRLIVTDSLFSMDGDLVDLPRLLELAEEEDAILYLDDAHAFGVLGPGGRGGLDHFGLRAGEWAHRLVWMGTLSKALGGAGAFVAGSEELVEWLRNRARTFIFSTAPPGAAAEAAREALAIVAGAEGEGLRRRLRENAERWRRGLGELGLDTRPSESHIVPVRVGEAGPTMARSAALLEAGVFVQGIRPPSVPPGTSRLRTAPMATHTPEDLEFALAAFRKVFSRPP